MNLLEALRGRSERMTLEGYVSLLNQFGYGGHSYPLGGNIQQTLAGGEDGEVRDSQGEAFVSLVHGAYASNGVVFACMLARQLAFSSVRFQWQQMLGGRPSRLFGTTALDILESPWPGGTTQDLLTRIINDADLSGTAYNTAVTPLARLGGDGAREIVRLRPDWVEVALRPRFVRGQQLGWRRAGYLYYEGGRHAGNGPVALTVGEVSAFSPIVDPLADWRGMSWLTPVFREIQADQLMNRHKRRFFDNGATPNMIVTYPVEAKPDQVRAMKALVKAEYSGVDAAYETIHIGGGADVTLVGKDLQQASFKEVQGAGETRIAAAARVHPVIVGLSEGLAGSSLNAGNYAQARRAFADGTMHPMWQNVAGSLAPLLGPAPRRGDRETVRLWYDTRDVPLLRQDEKDAAEIQKLRAETLNSWVTSGYTPDSALDALLADDEGLLQHSGLYSVQLQAPGASAPAPAADAAPQEGQPA